MPKKDLPLDAAFPLLILGLGAVIYFQEMVPMTNSDRDILSGFLMIFGPITYFFKPRKDEYSNLGGAWLFFVTLQFLFGTLLFLGFRHAFLPVRVAFNFIYWIAIAAAVCAGTIVGMALIRKMQKRQSARSRK